MYRYKHSPTNMEVLQWTCVKQADKWSLEQHITVITAVNMDDLEDIPTCNGPALHLCGSRHKICRIVPSIGHVAGCGDCTKV